MPYYIFKPINDFGCKFSIKSLNSFIPKLLLDVKCFFSNQDFDRYENT